MCELTTKSVQQEEADEIGTEATGFDTNATNESQYGYIYNIVKDTAQVYFDLITRSLFTMITPLGRYAFPLPSGCRPKCADV